MKQLFLLTALLISGVAQAKTVCNINTSSAKDQTTFDRILFSGEVSGQRIFVVNKEATAAEELDLNILRFPQKWKSLQGLTVVIFAPQENGDYSIGLAKAIYTKDQNTNLMPMKSLAYGAVQEGHALGLTSAEENLSLVCFRNIP